MSDKETEANDTLSNYRPQRVNANKHKPHGLAALDSSIRRDGYSAPMVAAADGEVFAGSARLEKAAEIFGTDVEPIVVHSDGTRPVIHIRDDIPTADDPRAKRLGVADNIIAKADYEPDGAILAMLAADDDLIAQLVKLDDDSTQAILDAANRGGGEGDAEPEISKADELKEKWGTERGQLWRIGDHILLCGDSTVANDVNRAFASDVADCIITDPPYCSGGFQEAGKKSGSIGTRGTEMIANDTLSTRGYIALMKNVLSLSIAGIAYIFTDWRMWINLFDVCESSGFGVRNMVVWDKQTPGMGRGWRSQHELIMVAMRVTQPFDPHKAQGNVIQADRTGNILHPTEKPVDLINKIIDVTDIANVIYDPFSGSGTTFVACQNMGKKCIGIELSPSFVAVILERMSTAFPNLTIERIE